MTAEGRPGRVDGMDRHRRVRDDAVPDGGTDGTGSVGCTDDGDRPRDQEPHDGARIGALLPALDAVEELLGRGELPVEIDHPRVEAALQRPSGLGEHRQHRPVVGQHLGGEPIDSVRPGDRREMFEHECRDALTLMGIVDHERRFGLGSAGPALVARPRDELAVRLDGEGDPVGHVDLGEVIEIPFGQLGLRREVPAVDAVPRLAAVKGRQRLAIVRREGTDHRDVAVAEHDRRFPR